MMAQPTAFITPCGVVPGAVSFCTTTQAAMRSCRAWRRSVNAAITQAPRNTTVPIRPNRMPTMPPISQAPSSETRMPAK